MKKWFRHSMEWKAGASLSYTAAVLIYAVVSLLLGEKNVSITVLFELLALCLADRSCSTSPLRTQSSRRAL